MISYKDISSNKNKIMNKGPSIFKEYVKHVADYKQKYGENTVVLMQVGSFYEIYAVVNDTDNVGEVNIYDICQGILGITVTKRDKKVREVSFKNYLMSGFQIDYSSKFINKLIEHNYHVVLIDQLSGPPNVVRGLGNIISPGTIISDRCADSNSFIMSLYIEKINHLVIGGVSLIDVSTGECYIYDIHKSNDTNFWKDEINKLINFYSPKEYIFQLYNIDLSKDDIINYWDITHSSIQLNHYTDSTYLSISYQNDILQKIYKCEGMLSPIESLDLEFKNELRNSLIYLLQYIYEHRVDITQNINKPKEIEDTNYLSLTSNSVRQLNVISNYSYYKGKNESLLAICDSCGTIMGKRMLKERLLYPCINSAEIDKRYTIIESMLQDNFYKCIRSNITKISDLDKSLRMMGLDMLSPNDLFTTKLSYDFAHRILQDVSNNELMNHYQSYISSIDTFTSFYKDMNSIFNFDNFHGTYNHTCETSLFHVTIYPEIDLLESSLKDIFLRIQCITKRISGIIESPNSCKLEFNDQRGWYIYCTKKRTTILKGRFKNIPNHNLNIRRDNELIYEIPCDSFTFMNKDKSNMIIDSPIIKELTDQLIYLNKQLKEKNTYFWNKTIHELYSNYSDGLRSFHQFIADIDVSSNNAKISLEHGYHRPIIKDSTKSFVESRGLRHPIVERLTQDTEYVCNDVTLGKDNHDGLLLFGTNACGKSTLMKAIGLNIIMAQAGLYVAASSFIFNPYRKIFTRILNNDNIFRSQSSFAVEMQELKTIFKSCDENSLILGDELCSGTETNSAISIVGSSLLDLAEKQTSFIITSHLHQLNDIEEVTTIPNLDIYHLQIEVEGNDLIYNRKMCKGAGPPIYGLKVCEAMGLPSDFIKNAKQIQNKLLSKHNSIVSTKSSQYNKDVFMDCCKICSATENLETHHIKEQCLADDNNMIDNHHKNKKHNVVALCKGCHDKVTYGNLVIYGYKETSKGPTLDYEYIKYEQTKKKKLTIKQVSTITGYKHLIEENEISKKNLIHLLDSKYDIKISPTILNKVLEGSY